MTVPIVDRLNMIEGDLAEIEKYTYNSARYRGSGAWMFCIKTDDRLYFTSNANADRVLRRIRVDGRLI